VPARNTPSGLSLSPIRMDSDTAHSHSIFPIPAPTDDISNSGLTSRFVEWYVYPRTMQFRHLDRPAYLSLSNTSDRDLAFSLTVPSSLIWANDQRDEPMKVPARSFAQFKFLAKESTANDRPIAIIMTIDQKSRRVPVVVSAKITRSKYRHSYHSSCGIWPSTHGATFTDEDRLADTPLQEVCVYPSHLHFRDSFIRHTATDYVTIENRSEKVQRWRCVPIAPAYVKQSLSAIASSGRSLMAATAGKSRTMVNGESTIRKVERDVFLLESRSGILAPRSAIRIPVMYTPHVSGTYLQFFQIQTSNHQTMRLEISGKATTVGDRMNCRVRVAQPRFRQRVGADSVGFRQH
jgi:hypothetical protein